MLGLKLNHVSKRGRRTPCGTSLHEQSICNTHPLCRVQSEGRDNNGRKNALMPTGIQQTFSTSVLKVSQIEIDEKCLWLSFNSNVCQERQWQKYMENMDRIKGVIFARGNITRSSEYTGIS